MNQKIFWTIFVVVQSIGAAVVLLPTSLPMALIDGAFSFAVVCLCPGLFVSTWLLDSPRLPPEDGGIVSLAIVLNTIFWFGVLAMMREIRRRSATRA
jgi:NhaP-type Na+/H+ or K+/H+ antiporter